MDSVALPTNGNLQWQLVGVYFQISVHTSHAYAKSCSGTTSFSYEKYLPSFKESGLTVPYVVNVAMTNDSLKSSLVLTDFERQVMNLLKFSGNNAT